MGAPETLETARRRAPEPVHILSPFDPLIIQRKRTELFFGYGHRFEAYVPKEKRLFGYFALPVLVGDEIVAAIDLKTDRKDGESADAEMELGRQRRGKGARKDLKRRIEEELHRFRAVSTGGGGDPSGARIAKASVRGAEPIHEIMISDEY